MYKRQEASLGDGRKEITEIERPSRRAMVRRILAARELPAGSVLADADLALLRADTGLEVGRLDLVVGRTLRRSLRAAEPIEPEMLE